MMPFARWETFDECKTEQMETGHSEDSAEKICGAIQARAEKGALLKSEAPKLDVLLKSDKDLIVGGYASWELKDPQRDVITTKAQVRFLQKFFHEPEHFRNIMWKHGGFQIGTPLLTYTTPSGETVYSHVNEVGTYLISKIRDNPWRSVQTVRKQVLNGTLKMYSISGDPVSVHYMREGGEMTRYVDDIDPWEVTLCEKGVNPKTAIRVLSKAEQLCKPCVDKWVDYYLMKGRSLENARMMAEKLVLRKYEAPLVKVNECDTSVCKGICCTFVTEWSTRVDDDLKKYLKIHGVETKEGEGGMWLKYPVVCEQFNQETYECMDWLNRPDICKQYPQRESPFIPLEKCSLLKKSMHPIRKEGEVVKTWPTQHPFEEIFQRNWRKYVK